MPKIRNYIGDWQMNIFFSFLLEEIDKMYFNFTNDK